MTKRPGIRIAPDQIQIVKKARYRLFCRQQDLADKLGISRATVQAFLRGDRVSRLNFEEICLALHLNWEEIADFPKSAIFPNKEHPELEIEALVKKIRQQCYDKTQTLYGKIKPLEISQPIDIENIYVDLNVVEQITRSQWLENSELMFAFNPEGDNCNRLCKQQRQEKLPIIDAVKKYKRLMVLGKAGSGKTTFLQHLAIQCNEGKFQGDLVPIFISLKDFARYTKTEWDFKLLNYISREFEFCGIDKKEINEILKNGRALILMDGLNEVSDEDQILIGELIQELTQDYFENQVIITCRKDACKYMFSRFTDVELSDFNQNQINSFAEKWFVALGKNNQEACLALAREFTEKLNYPNNQHIRELAVIPLFLHIICLVFQENSEFPSMGTKLYEDGLDMMLRKWDEVRGMVRQEACVMGHRS